jgi:carbamoyltransferase
MLTLGLSMEHDASAAVARDGALVAAVSEERLTRNKGQWGYPFLAVDECLRLAGATRADVDVYCVALNKFPSCYLRRPSWLAELGERWHRARRALLGRREDVTVGMMEFLEEARRRGVQLADLFDRDRFAADGFRKAEVRFVDHHAAHAWGAALHGGFDDALVLTVDCVGACCAQDEDVPHTLESLALQSLIPLSHTTSSWKDGLLRRLWRSGLDGSPGSFYGSVTEGLGFISPRHEGKVTGLAAWSKERLLDGVFGTTLALAPEGSHFTCEQVRDDPPNISEARKAVIHRAMKGVSREEVSGSAQRVLEQVVLGHARWALAKTGHRRLALAGGVFGNVKLNQHLMELPGVESIFVFPAMSDAGLAAAAAQMVNDPPPRKGAPLRDVYLGSFATNAEVEAELKGSEFTWERVPEADRARRAARFVADGKVLGLHQGRMEYGPRALGNRTILASPTDARINDELNQRLSRSEFMPFAPSVLAERCADIFEDYDRGAHAAEFMTVTFTVKPEWRDRIPAVVHVDGTARPQAVSREKNPRYYDILKAYERMTGLPVVVNTSFNVHEEPIVCRPRDALQALRERRVDALLIEDFWVTA